MGTKVYDNYADLITFNRNSKGTALRPIGYGDELVTNGTFDTASDWTLGTGWSITGGELVASSVSNSVSASQNLVTTQGTVYLAVYTLSNVTAGSVRLQTNNKVLTTRSSDGTYSEIFVQPFTGQSSLRFQAVGTFSGTIDNVSVKEVLFDREGDPLTLFLHPEGVPRIEYDADRNLKGLLIEPESTNQIRNGSATGSATGVVGSGGALPTNWNTAAIASGISIEVIGTGTEIGVSYIDLKFSGTATETKSTRVAFEASTHIVAAPSEVWTTSFFAKTIDLTAAYDAVGVQQTYRTSAGVFVNANVNIVTLTSSLARYSETGTAPATTERVVPEIAFSITNGNTYDFTVRVGWAQIEESPIATSAMPTTGSTFTRGKDDASMTNVSGLIGQKEGTLYVEVDFRTAGTAQYILSVSDGTGNNWLLIWVISGSTRMYIDAGGGNLINTGDTNLSDGVQKLAFAYANGDQEFYRNGSSVIATTSSLAALGTLTDIDLGQSVSTGGQANMHIRAVQIIPRRLSDEQLIELTS